MTCFVPECFGRGVTWSGSIRSSHHGTLDPVRVSTPQLRKYGGKTFFIIKLLLIIKKIIIIDTLYWKSYRYIQSVSESVLPSLAPHHPKPTYQTDHPPIQLAPIVEIHMIKYPWKIIFTHNIKILTLISNKQLRKLKNGQASVGFCKKIAIVHFKNLDILTRFYIYRELVPFFQCCEHECPSSLCSIQVLQTCQSYASLPRLSGWNVTITL